MKQMFKQFLSKQVQGGAEKKGEKKNLQTV